MRNSQALMLLPDWKVSRKRQARARVSCTTSSASVEDRVSTKACARSFGIRRTISLRRTVADGAAVLVGDPHALTTVSNERYSLETRAECPKRRSDYLLISA